MTTDTLTTITKLIQSPPGQLAAGGVLAGIVWKFFERVEAVLTDQTKLEIAVWLLGVKVGQKVEPWPDTFAKVFDRVFGEKHLSWKCFWRSFLASSLSWVVVFGVTFLVALGGFDSPKRHPYDTVTRQYWVAAIILPFVYAAGTAAFDYCSLLETRLALAIMRRSESSSVWSALLVIDLGITFITSAAAYLVWGTLVDVTAADWIGSIPLDIVPVVIQNYIRLLTLRLHHFGPTLLPYVPGGGGPTINIPFYASGLVTSIWLWLYAGSGFLLKAARRFDTGFDWFNRHFDIEKKPLQAIGLVAGALVAVVYWAAVIVSRVVR